MAIAYASVRRGVSGNFRTNVVDITLDGSYAAGGYALTAASLGVGTILMLIPYVRTGENVIAQYDGVNVKLKVLKGASTVTVTSGNAAFSELAANDTLISANTVVRCWVVGDPGSG